MAFNFKSEKDVQEYLNNLYVEYSYGCYSEKSSEACHLLGEYFETVKRNFKDAANIYRQNCENLDHAKSCSKFGGWKLLGRGCEKNISDAYTYLRKSCTLNDVKGCTASAIMAVSRPEIHKDDKKVILEEGVKVLDKSCNVQNCEQACFYLAGIYITGIKNVLEKNHYQAYKLSLKACELGNHFSCANVAQMHLKGEGAQKNKKLAETFFKRAEELAKETRDLKRQMTFGKGIPV